MAEKEEVDLTDVFSSFDKVVKNTDLSGITAESSGFSDLKPGYYLCSLDKACFKKAKKDGAPQIMMQFNVVEDGVAFEQDDRGNDTATALKGTKNRKIFKYYPIRDDASLKRFVSDMLKFIDPKTKASLLPPEAFMNHEVVATALEALEGSRIYVSLTESGEGESKSIFPNLISWTRAEQISLPM